MNLFFNRKHKLKDISSFDALSRMQRIILNSLDFNTVVTNCVNSVLSELGYLKLGYRIIVLVLADQNKRILQRTAISQTPEAKKALEITPVPFKNIIIPLEDKESSLVKALETKNIQVVTDWYDILRPAYTREEAIEVQTAVGIKTSMVFPVYAQAKPVGALIFSMIKDYFQVSEDEKLLLTGFSDLVGLAVQNSGLYTSLQETTKQLQVANVKLKELDRLKDDFVSIASHELRTPMTAIRSYSWMALNRPDVPLTAKMRKYLSRTLISTERLIKLVNDMLNISRIESGRVSILPQPFDIRELIEEVIAEVSSKAKEKNLHVFLIRTAIPSVFADSDKVHQVILNLLGNSLKFTPEGGSIALSTFTDGNMVEVSIKDSGVGISADDLPRLFAKFGRLDESYVASATSGGTGLGLYICKSLIELMKGKIWAKSDGIGKGATLTFSLPVASPRVLASADDYTRHVGGEEKPLEPVTL